MPRLGFVWWAVATRVITLVPGWITNIRRKLDYKEGRSEVTLGEKVGPGGGYGENGSQARNSEEVKSR